MRGIGASLMLLTLLAACGQESTTPSVEVEAFDMLADNVGHGIEQYMTHNGVRTATVWSDTTYFHGDRFDLFGVRVTFFDETGGEAGNLTSETGDYNQDSGTFIARGNVVLTSSREGEDTRLETEELHYDMRADSLWTEVPFTLLEDGRESTGTSFRSDSELRTWTVTGARTTSAVGESGVTF